MRLQLNWKERPYRRGAISGFVSQQAQPEPHGAPLDETASVLYNRATPCDEGVLLNGATD
ncbi:MAG: hypothetical protein QOJ39_3353 [Candidatus Eremiobacteraeota bacterium]|nr:hypothetical protein [Candidatus Eremiobacteraeota bacterium]